MKEINYKFTIRKNKTNSLYRRNK